MDPRERVNWLNEALLAALEARQATIWTALPCTVVSFNPAQMTCVLQPAIKGRVQNKDGTWQFVTITKLEDCPVIFPSGGGFTLTFPINPGDEALAIFAQRCIDAWWQNGGVQPPMEYRLHDPSDGFCLVGPRSKPRFLNPAPSTIATQLRTDDGTAFLEITPNPNGAGYMIRAQAAEVQLHATYRLKTDCNGYGQVVTYIGNATWQVDTYETPTPQQTVISNSHNINPPEVPG